jgi:alanine-glyoxylate transaminase / serine-glyoxylate transaminase / serine-pyruvate transaminase
VLFRSPGLGPLTVGPRASELLHKRKNKVPNFYLDLAMLERYWGDEHAYHHTAPISMIFALREALRLVQEEGLENRIKRHKENANILWDGLEEIGLKMLVPANRRLPTLTVVLVPEGVNELDVRRRLLDEYNIEIAGGFGALKGKVWRIGLMGYSSRPENIILLLSALARILAK